MGVWTRGMWLVPQGARGRGGGGGGACVPSTRCKSDGNNASCRLTKALLTRTPMDRHNLRCPVHEWRPARLDRQTCSNRWQDSNQHPQNTIPRPKSPNKLDLQGPSEKGTGKFDDSKSCGKQSSRLRCCMRCVQGPKAAGNTTRWSGWGIVLSKGDGTEQRNKQPSSIK